MLCEVYMYITYLQLFGYGWWSTLWRLIVVVLTQCAIMLIMIVVVIYFYEYDEESRFDPDTIIAILFILAVTVALTAVMLLATHLINLKTYKKSKNRRTMKKIMQRTFVASRTLVLTKKLVLTAFFCGILLVNFFSCTAIEDTPSGQSDIVKPEAGFFTSKINALIDANYPEVINNGYAELIIPSTMFDPSIMKYADYHKDVMTALNQLGYKTYINGGAVRDAILGTDIHDLDFSTDATPEAMKEKLTGYEVSISMTNGGSIAKAHHPNGDWTDMVPIKGVYESLRGKPFVPADAVYSTYSTRLLDDSYTRDLTINSIYYDFQTNTIIDYHGGLHDLRDKIIRTVYDANTMYSINASALIRTVRFAARYGFDIDAATTTAIRDNMHYCKEKITGAMNNYYINKGFGDGYVRRTYQYYSKYGIVDYFMLGLKGYAGTADYEEPMLNAIEYIESKTKVSNYLAISVM